MTIGISLLMTASLRIAGLSVAAWLVTLALRRSSAAARHLVWMCAMVAALLMPALLQLPTRPVVVPMAAAPVPERSVQMFRAAVPQPHATPTIGPAVTPAAAVPVPDQRPSGDVPVVSILFAVWAAVGAAALVWVGNGMAATARLRRMTTRANADWVKDARAIATAMGIRHVNFLEVSAPSTPFTCGIFSSTVVLPSEVSAWTAERLRAVLLHELAHVRRHDCLTQLLTRVACAIYWFHPGVWFTAHRLRAERERACDDVVLMAGVQGSAYGQHLVAIARAALSLPSGVAAGGVAMAHRGRLEERLVFILDPRVVRRSAWSARIVIAVFGMLALGAATVHVQAETPRLAVTRPMENITLVTQHRDITGASTVTDREIPRAPAAVRAHPQDQTRAQAPTPAAAPPTIEVALIKRNKADEDQRKVADPRITRYPGRAQTLRGGILSGRAMTVKELIRDAYGYRNRAHSEVVGGPAWLDTEVYDVQAKFDQEFRLSSSLGLPPEGELALRTLLAERFHLKAHREIQRRPIYEMVVKRADGRLGPNLKPSKGGCIPFSKREPINVGLVVDQPGADDPKPLRPCMAAVGIFGITLENEAMADWARLLSVRPQLDRTVIDRTGLTGDFDFSLDFKSVMQPDAPLMEVPIKPQLESQLGLTLRDAEGDVEVLVIDSIDHPTEN